MSLTHERSIRVGRSSDEVLAYVSRAEKLPSWTGFFTSIDKGPGDTFLAETKVGPAALSLPVQRTQQGAVVELQVCVNGRTELARIVISRDNSRRVNSTLITFQTGFPLNWEPAQIANQLTELEVELERLRDSIEHPFEEGVQRVIA